ncbi:flagellar hook-associated protein FlgL [Pseudothermotoga thermarum]|uniref:Flagellar hook-associated protein 3 n=1 Tax=Pseudothermotoga thermarum DSM 5069 TaxID=688269 RepID=F7YYV2_9THEM|nr:flagellar hook-associated protein FlgL [Pseudothermotoga thermarum]AEH51145.1 flagellar hook-associated protein 3 [Pseudothermotoga thermarum DSM 5069]
MRVTDRMISDRVLANIQSSISRIAKLHDQLSSGLAVRYPSDDAIVATRSSNLESRLREIEQYKRNLNQMQSIVNAYDSTLQEISTILVRIRELSVQAANGTLSPDDRKVIAEELKQIKQHLIQVANTQVGNDYIFAGYASDKPPVDESGKIVLDSFKAGSRSVNVLGYTLNYGLTVYDLFVTDTNESVFEIIDRTVDALEKNDQSKLSTISLSSLEYLEKRLSENIAKVGANQRMAELISGRLEDLNIYLTEFVSKERDADLTKVITDLSMQQAALEAALKSAARVLRTTLVDFIT